MFRANPPAKVPCHVICNSKTVSLLTSYPKQRFQVILEKVRVIGRGFAVILNGEAFRKYVGNHYVTHVVDVRVPAGYNFPWTYSWPLSRSETGNAEQRYAT